MKPADSGADQHVLLKSKPMSDETRAFLTFSSSGDDIDSRSSSINSVEHGACRRSFYGRSAWNYLTIFLTVAVALLAIAVLVLQLYRSREADGLRSELDALRREIDKLNHRIVEVELWDQLKAFEAAVYAEEAATDDGDDDDGSDDDDDVSDDEDDYDVDYDVDEDVTRHEKKQLAHPLDELNKHTADLPQEPVERTKREIETSVPVVSRSYGVDLKQNNNSEGLRLYESLVTSGGKNEPKDLSLDWGSTENPIKSYHRVSPLWTSKSQHKKYVDAPAQLNEAPAIHRRHRERSQRASTKAPSPIISRPSRVMQTDPNPVPPPPPPPSPPPRAPLTIRPFITEPEVVVRVLQEHRAPEAGVVSGPGDVAKTRRRKKRPPHKSLPLIQAPRALAAVHYNGDTSQYSIGHQNYEGNGRLRHPDGKFMDWKPASWSQHLGLRNFNLREGEVVVRDSGIYFIYAQIYYVDEHDINGFRVYVNDNPILHCTTMTVHLANEQRRPKFNTCHTSGATYLSERDKVSVRDVNGLRYSLFEPAKSFFGLIKLSDATLK